MTRWVFGSLAGALAVAPIGFDGFAPQAVAWPAKVVFVALLVAGLTFAALAVVWGRPWKLTVR